MTAMPIKKTLMTVIFVAPLLMAVVFAWLRIEHRRAYLRLVREDSILEWSQVLLYVASALVAVLMSRMHLCERRRSLAAFYAVVALGLLAVALEEISWGQRLFAIRTPEILEVHNTQREISIHNLRPVQGLLHDIYILVGACGALAWIVTDRLARRMKPPDWEEWKHIVPHWPTSSYFFLLFLTYTAITYIAPPMVGGLPVWRDQESAELFLAMGVFFWALINYSELRGRLRERGASAPAAFSS